MGQTWDDPADEYEEPDQSNAPRILLVVPPVGAPHLVIERVTLDLMQRLVTPEGQARALVEHLGLGNERRDAVYVHEEGLLLSLPYNAPATALARTLAGPHLDASQIYLVGTAWFATDDGVNVGSVSDRVLDLAGLA